MRDERRRENFANKAVQFLLNNRFDGLGIIFGLLKSINNFSKHIYHFSIFFYYSDKDYYTLFLRVNYFWLIYFKLVANRHRCNENDFKKN